MFSTNLPTETLYKTCFTLGLILLVFTMTVRFNQELEIEKNHLQLESDFKIKKIRDSLRFKKVRENITKLEEINKKIKQNGIWIQQNKKKLTLNELDKSKLFNDSLNFSFKKVMDEIDTLQSKSILNNVIMKHSIKKLNRESQKFNDFNSKYYKWLFIISFVLIVFGFCMWLKMQKISDQTAKLNKEKIELEIENLKLSQKRYFADKPLSENQDCND